MRPFLRDLTWGVRALRATPAAAAAAVLTIALGTGVNTAVFAVAYGVLLRPLPCPEPSRIVVVSLHAPNGREFWVPLTEIEEWRRRVRTFEASGAYSITEVTVRGIGEPRLVRTALVTPSFFDVLRVAPREGRAPSASDPDEWMVLGSGLAGQRVRPGQGGAAWIPAAPLAQIRLASGREVPRTLRLMARLKRGVSLEQARDDAQRAFAEVPTTREDRGTARVRTLDDVLFGEVRPVLNALVVAAMLVLLVACGNVATLLVSIATGVVPRVDAIAVDLPVLVVTVLVAAGVTLVCGLAPAIHAARSDFGLAFRGSHASASRGARLTRRALIVAQVALSVVLLSGAGLVGRTVLGLSSDRAGADPDRALVVRLSLADTARFDLASRMPAIREMLRTVRALPGVEHAALGTNVPPRVSSIMFTVEQRSQGHSTSHAVYLASVTSEFFPALGTRVIEGHGIDEADEQRDGPVIVLSQSAAQLLSPGKSLVGRELPWPLPAGAGKGRLPFVVGVVADVKYGGLDAPAFAAIYTRWADLPASVGYLLVRTSGDPALLASTIGKTLRNVDPSMAVADIRTLRQEYATSIADRRARLVPAAGFAGLAVAVALVGLGGLLARAVTERRRELAIRMALGSSPSGAVNIIVREGTWLAAAGVVLGLGAAAGAGRWLGALLYGVSPLDPLTFGSVALFVSAAALLTSLLAARRAARVEPVELLRSE